MTLELPLPHTPPIQLHDAWLADAPPGGWGARTVNALCAPIRAQGALVRVEPGSWLAVDDRISIEI